jgi:hypothetical protein
MGKVFLCYRREDSGAHAGRVKDWLERDFGADVLFMDVDNIPMGRNFVKVLRAEVTKCEVLLAFIGRNWLDVRDEDGSRRLDNPNDFVRIEIAEALQRDVPVVPILLDGARIPSASHLPTELEELSVRQGIDLRLSSFQSDVERLSDGLQKHLKADAATTKIKGSNRVQEERPKAQSAKQAETEQDNFALPRGYEYLRADCERFFVDHPDYRRNVFIMTRLDDRDPLLRQLDEQLRKALCCHSLAGIRVGDHMYSSDNEPWENVCVHMLCCKYGVAIFENRAKDEFHSNVALEYGFMRALDKRTLLLTDRSCNLHLRANIVDLVREEFDINDLAHTLAVPIERWIHSLDVDLKAGGSNLQRQALKAHRRLMNIKCAELVSDEAQRTKEEDDEFWYFGEELRVYRTLLRKHTDPDHNRAVEDAQRLVEGHNFGAVNELIERFAALAH